MMTIYTVFFVRSDRTVPEFELGEFPSLRTAMEAAAEMAKAHRGACRAEIYDQHRQVAVLPLHRQPCEIVSADSPPGAPFSATSLQETVCFSPHFDA